MITESVEVTLAAIREELLRFQASSRLQDRAVDIFEWIQKSSYCKLMKDLAAIAISVPVTQVSVERVFSGLKYILNDLRGSLSEDSVQNIMFLRCNGFY